MLRITVVDSSNLVVRLRIEGRLTGRCVEELRRSCELQAPGEGARLTLDLADLSFADSEGVELLQDLKCHNVELLNLVPFLALQLHNAKEGRQQNPGGALEGNR